MKNKFIKLLTLISIAGAYCVAFDLGVLANMLWSFSNPLFAIHNYKSDQKEQAVLFGVFTIAAWLGVIRYFYLG